MRTALATYPPLRNRFITAAVALSSRTKIKISTANVVDTVGEPSKGDETLRWGSRLHVVSEDDMVRQERLAVGELRDAAASIRKLYFVSLLGASIFQAVKSTLEEHPTWISLTTTALTVEDSTLPNGAIDAVRGILANATDADDVAPVASCSGH